MQKELNISIYWKSGEMLYNRECLPYDHPEYIYNYIKNTFGISPEDYGIFHPYYLKYKDLNKKQLMSKLGELEFENEKLKKRINEMEIYL